MAASDFTVTVQVDGGLLAEDQATWDVLTSAVVTGVSHPERVEVIITDRYQQIAGGLEMLSPVHANEETTATDYRADKPDGASAVVRLAILQQAGNAGAGERARGLLV